MKKYLLVFAFALAALLCAAQKPSPKLQAFHTAVSLVRYGYANYSASALAQAASILADVNPRRAPEGELMEASSDKEDILANPEVLLRNAREMAGEDAVVLAFIDQVQKKLSETTRGAVGGPVYDSGVLDELEVKDHKISFVADELAEVIIESDGTTNFDLYVFDENGNLVSSDTDYGEFSICRWIPVWTGRFTIRVVNNDYLPGMYLLATN